MYQKSTIEAQILRIFAHYKIVSSSITRLIKVEEGEASEKVEE